MKHSVGVSRRVLIGALALLVAGATSASAQTAPTSAAPAPMPMKTDTTMPPPGLLKVSDTITLRGGRCWIVSDPTDSGTSIEKPEVKTPRICRFAQTPVWNASLSVPSDPDETINFNYTIKPDGSITGSGREGLNQAAYRCTVTGQTKPGTKMADIMKVGATFKVWQIPSLP